MLTAPESPTALPPGLHVVTVRRALGLLRQARTVYVLAQNTAIQMVRVKKSEIRFTLRGMRSAGMKTVAIRVLSTSSILF